MSARFHVGDAVLVRNAWPEDGPTRVHIRTPHYVRGQRGVIGRVLGTFPNPEDLAFGRPGLPAQPLYQVRFRQRDIWPRGGGEPGDSIAADLYEHWLEPATTEHGHG
jgi:nitrile hydratase